MRRVPGNTSQRTLLSWFRIGRGRSEFWLIRAGSDLTYLRTKKAATAVQNPTRLADMIDILAKNFRADMHLSPCVAPFKRVR